MLPIQSPQSILFLYFGIPGVSAGLPRGSQRLAVEYTLQNEQQQRLTSQFIQSLILNSLYYIPKYGILYIYHKKGT